MEEYKKLQETFNKGFKELNKSLRDLSKVLDTVLEINKKQKKHNTWFIHNFIMGDESKSTQHVEVPKFKSKSEKFDWYLNQINIE